MELLKELTSAWSQRIRSPLAGSVSIAFFVLNWKPIWYLLFADRPVRQKFLYFDANTNQASLFWLPLAIGIAIALLLPWITLFGAFCVRKPLKKLRTLQHDEALDQKIYQLEKSAREIEVRARLEEASERSKIEAAQRLKDAQTVGGDDLRDEIEADRIEKTGTEVIDLQPSTRAQNTLKKISREPRGTFEVYDSEGAYKLRVGSKNMHLDDRRQYLQFLSDVEELRKLGLIENDANAISDLGYKFLDRPRDD